MILVSNSIENKIKDKYLGLFEEQAKSKGQQVRITLAFQILNQAKISMDFSKIYLKFLSVPISSIFSSIKE